MADVTVKMGVSGISQFKQGMNDASASVKTFDAALKANEKQLKATGNAENYMQAQTTLLNGKLEAQKKIVKNAEQALKQMEQNGVKTTSAAYQNMQRRLIEAQSGMMDTEQALNSLGSTATEAAGKTDKLQESLGGIGKKLSLDQVISGIDSITGAMEKAAKKAVDLGKQIWENITDAARWSDDVNTQAAILGMDVEDYQAYKDVFDTMAEITVAEWQKAKLKVQKAMQDPTSDQLDVLTALGLAPQYGGKGSLTVEQYAGDWEDMLWDIGQKLRDKVASGEMSMDLADVYANALFGKSFANLNPLFDMGKDAFYEAVEKQTVASKEAIEANAELNDKLIALKGDVEQLKAELTAGLAPALSAAADAISNLLGNIMEYLKSPDGQKALADLSTAVSGLFDDLGKIDPEQVVKGFTDVFNSVVGSVQWLVENKDGVVRALEWILGGWATLKVTGGVLDIVKLISGIKGLTAASAAEAGAAAGASWGGGFASAVMKAAPWLIGLYTLLNPASGSDSVGDNTLIDENGNLTNEAKEYGYKQTESGEAYLDRTEILKQAAEEAWDLMRTNQLDAAAMARIKETIMSDEAFNAMVDRFMDVRNGNQGWKNIEDLDMTKWAEEFGKPEIPAEIKLPDNQAQMLTEAIGTVLIHGKIVTDEDDGEHANGIWSVPFDGYRAVLHKGEQVVPAREVGSSRNYSSNLYVESMYMNNSTDAEGLAAAIAAANRRTMRGYGSR